MRSPSVSTPARHTAYWSPTAAFLNIFRWRQHIVYIDNLGVKHERWETPIPLPDPITIWSGLTLRGFFAAVIGFSAAFVDAFDYHGMGIQTIKLANYYNVSKGELTSAITVTMVCRIAGAVLCGIWADYQGRKWALCFTLWFLAVVQFATVFAGTFQQFLAIRALFGIGMGGVFGSAASFAFEEIPVDARGIFSGIFQASYSLSFLLAAVINLIVGPEVDTWKTLFWVGGAMSFVVGIARAVFPEATIFVQALETSKPSASAKNFFNGLRTMLRIEWPTFVYATWFVCWYSVFGHASGDSQVTFLIDSKGISYAEASRIVIISKVGAVIGSILIAYVSMIVYYLLTAMLLPASILPNSVAGLMAGCFWTQLTSSAWAVVPVWLSEIANPSFRSLVIGTSYQLGILISAPATQIVNIAAERYRVVSADEKLIEAYGPVIGVASAVSAVICAIILSFGPERLGRHFEKATPAIVDGAVFQDVDSDAAGGHEIRSVHSSISEGLKTETAAGRSGDVNA